MYVENVHPCLSGGAACVQFGKCARASLPCDVLLSDWHSLRKHVVSYIDIAVGQGFPTFFRRGPLFFFQSGMDPQGADLARILN